MEALPLRGLSAVDHVLVGMLWPNTRWNGLAEVRRGCPCPPASRALLLLSYQQTELWSQAVGCSCCIWHEEHRVQTLQDGNGIEFVPCI